VAHSYIISHILVINLPVLFHMKLKPPFYMKRWFIVIGAI